MYDWKRYLRGFASAHYSINLYPEISVKYWIKTHRDTSYSNEFIDGRTDGFLSSIGE